MMVVLRCEISLENSWSSRDRNREMVWWERNGVVGEKWCGGREMVWWERNGVVGEKWCGGRET